ncbi:MAG: gamma-glutamyl-gamma-aminobutyrate hydrolase family protein [Candidatus Rokubacteria bacterium]|nr:gamma-glutamyl-gamma-aminobutyrate hydrolase family protein [Betaproteobacteria bacterium]MBM4441083.1 gamma-glutamyl-gamma-aminobutyrate hydrolase family protein [Candidatus Rokubacteria bacterium]
MRKPLKIGLSARFLHRVPREMGFRGKKLQYLEQTIAHWLMTASALVFMVPSIAGGGLLRRGNVRVADYVAELDALVLQGGADVSPLTYGDQALKPEWEGDRVRDMYEMDLVQEFIAAGKPVLGICRGLQLINVAFGGTLYQDLSLRHAQAGGHHDREAYDQNFHEIALVPGSGLARLYPGLARAHVSSIHHQGIKDLGMDLAVEALSLPDKVIEAIRWKGEGYVVGVQWHPEFHDPERPDLLDGTPLLREFLDRAETVRDGKSKATVPAGAGA